MRPRTLPPARVALAALLALVLEAAAQERRHSVRVPMRDGADLAADLHLPEKPGRYPTILVQTPYNRRNFGAALPRRSLAGGLLDPERTAHLVMDWRGFHGSRDAGRGRFLPNRGRDGHDAVEWIAAQPWSDGRVGTWGPSALGVIQFQTALERPPHLACAVPVVSHMGLEYGQYYDGGVYRKSTVEALDVLGFGLSRFVLAGRTYGPYWRRLEEAPRPERIEVPMLLIGGWYDLYTDGVLMTFRALSERGGGRARRESRLLIGPWHHSAMGQAEQGELRFPAAEGEDRRVAQRFFDRWLRGEENGWDEEPVVRWFQMDASVEGGGIWRSAESWPPPSGGETVLHLRGGGRLGSGSDREGSPADTFPSDPADPVPTVGGNNLAPFLRAGPRDQSSRVEGRKDVVTYTSDPLEKPVALLGNARAVLFVSSDRTDTDIAVRLCEVLPDGRSMLVADGIRRMRFRNSLEKEELMEPGRVYEVEVLLPVTALTFPAGHRVRLSVASSNHPRFGVNPQSGKNRFDAEGGLVALNRVHHDPEHPSRLILPLAPGP